MIIKTDDIEGTEIREVMAEIERKYGLTGDQLEAAATHIVMTDTDWDSDPNRYGISGICKEAWDAAIKSKEVKVV